MRAGLVGSSSGIAVQNNLIVRSSTEGLVRVEKRALRTN